MLIWNIHLNISTAASIGLLLQPIQIASLCLKKKEHIEIFEAIAQKEPEKARKAVKTHIQNAAKRRGLNIS